jgi:hypothetical protein
MQTSIEIFMLVFHADKYQNVSYMILLCSKHNSGIDQHGRFLPVVHPKKTQSEEHRNLRIQLCEVLKRHTTC